MNTAPRTAVPRGRQPRLRCPPRRLQGLLQILRVGRRVLVDDHEIHRQLFHPPVFMGAQQLADDLQVLDVVDPADDDRQVAGNAEGPQLRRSADAASERVG